MIEKIKDYTSLFGDEVDDSDDEDISTQPSINIDADNDTSSDILSDGVLDANKYNRSDFSLTTLYNKISEVVTSKYSGDIDNTINPESGDPAEIVVGRGIGRVIGVSVLSIPLYIFLVWTGKFPIIPEYGFVVSIVTGFLLSGATAMVSLAVWLIFTIGSVVDRGKKINTVLPEALSFMYAQSNSDVNYLNIVRAMAMAEDAYGPVAKEFQAIVRRCEYFGEDIQTAIKQQAEDTPSEELSRVLRNMVSHIQNGSNLTEFFDEEATKARNRVENEHKVATDFLSFLSTIYATVGLMPVFGLAVLVGISSFQEIPNSVMATVAYFLVPSVTVIFIYLIDRAHIEESSLGALTDSETGGVSSINLSDDTLDTGNESHRTLSSAFGVANEQQDHQQEVVGQPLHPASEGLVNTESASELDDKIAGSKVSIFETKEKLKQILYNPIDYFTDNPSAALYVTIPFTTFFMGIQVLLGLIPVPSVEIMTSNPLTETIRWMYVPLVIIFTPTTLFYHNQQRRAKAIEKSFPDTLRRLASANDSGLSLTEAIEEVGERGENVVDREMSVVAAKSKLGVPVDRGLAEFNNVYKQPQIARSTRLLIEAYRASSAVGDVLGETIESAETGLQLQEDERSEKKSQLLTIGVVTLAGAGLLLIVDRFFLQLALEGIGIGVLTQSGGIGGAAQAAQQTDTQSSGDFLSMVLFHTAFIHSLLAGVFLGYLNKKSFIDGMKYSLILGGVSILAWTLM